jgi:DNA modification methylase
MKPYYEDKWVRIYNQNCLDTMNLMPDNIIDLTVTSPPYDNLREYRGYSLDFENVASELYRVTKQGGTVVWIVNDATIDGDETGTSFKQALYFKAVGLVKLNRGCYHSIHDDRIKSWARQNFGGISE